MPNVHAHKKISFYALHKSDSIENDFFFPSAVCFVVVVVVLSRYYVLAYGVNYARLIMAFYDLRKNKFFKCKMYFIRESNAKLRFAEEKKNILRFIT